MCLHSLIEEGGDWDRRNRLKVYQGLYCVAIRDFKQAAELFLDTVSTFTSYELMDYKTFVTYTVYVCMIAQKRPDLREKVGSRRGRFWSHGGCVVNRASMCLHNSRGGSFADFVLTLTDTKTSMVAENLNMFIQYFLHVRTGIFKLVLIRINVLDNWQISSSVMTLSC